MLSKEQSFKLGVLLRCTEAGLNIQETNELVKEAAHLLKTSGFWSSIGKLILRPVEKVTDKGVDVAGNMVGQLGSVGLGALIGGPAVVGAGLGYAGSRMTDLDDTDVDAIKKRELIDEYLRQAKRLRMKQRQV